MKEIRVSIRWLSVTWEGFLFVFFRVFFCSLSLFAEVGIFFANIFFYCHSEVSRGDTPALFFPLHLLESGIIIVIT